MSARLFSTLGRFSMALALPALIAPAPLLATEDPDDDLAGETPERYAQVKAVEGDVRIRKGDVEEALERGTPVAEGDTIESRGRGVLQLGDGSRIAFAPGTRLQVAALFQDNKGQPQVLLRLDRGRIRVNLGSDSEARIRVDTPAGTATLSDPGAFTLEAESDRTVRLRVHSGRVGYENEADRARLSAGERLTVYGSRDRLDRVRSFNTYDFDAFDDWCESAMQGRRSASRDRVPSAIRYYADDLDDNGEWVYVDETSSWCWRPLRVGAEWRPYWRGRWGSYAGGMTWVSSEPWGYVTHHYGRWGWTSRWGWYWIPGVYYSPAWVAWNNYDSYFGWAPLGYWNTPCTWGYGAWGGGYCWNVVGYHHLHGPHLHTRVHVDVNLFHHFSGSGRSAWSGPGHRPGGDLTPPWKRGRLLVTAQELRQPDQFRRVVADRSVLRTRMTDYARQGQATGRTLVRRELPTVPQGGVPGRESRPQPFERPGQPRDLRPIVREGRGPSSPGASRAVPTRERDSGPSTPSIERQPPTRDRSRDEHPRILRERPIESPRQGRTTERDLDRPRGVERERERPTVREARPEPSRDSRPIERPTVRESRPEPSRESRPAERPTVRESRPEPSRSAPSSSPSRSESRPAPERGRR